MTLLDRHYFERLSQPAGAVRIFGHPRCAKRLNLQRRLGDDAGQAEATERRVEKIRVCFRGEVEELAARREECDRAHVARESSILVVVLAVDVAGDRAAQRHLRCSGHDRQR